jgi:predicted nucleic acid-binding protein
MKEFFDKSVLIAAFRTVHPHHRASLERLSGADPSRSACGVHSLAEFYSVSTTLRPMILPEQAMLFISDIRSRASLVVLTTEDYVEVIRHLAGTGVTGGRICDALLLACATKSGAETIYTWNVRHFQSLAPHVASRIRTP